MSGIGASLPSGSIVAKLGNPTEAGIGRASDMRFEAVRSHWLVSIRLAEREPGA